MIRLLLPCLLFACCLVVNAGDAYSTALANATPAAEAFRRADAVVHAWLAQADPASGLLPQGLTDERIWRVANAAADLYPFLVLTAAVTDRNLFDGRMHDILRAEQRLTNRVGPLPDDWSLNRQGFVHDDVDLERVIFGSSEYVKDGLLPMTEWLGASAWSERMIEITRAIWERAPVETPFGRIPADDHEVNGEMMQVVSRLYWMTGDPIWKEYAFRLGDYFLLGTHHPTRDAQVLRLRDHGCEVVSGLSEVYALAHYASPEKKAAYREPLYAALDRILEIGRNDDGLFYNRVNMQTGEVVDRGVADTWGYNFNTFYTVYLLDATTDTTGRATAYREATLRAMAALWPHYRDFRWEGTSADGYADSIECAIYLYRYERILSVAKWIDSEIQVMFAKQRDDGTVGRTYPDGNFARTALLYAFWKTAGAIPRPWRADVRLGAHVAGDTLHLALDSDAPWQGRVLLDGARHRDVFHLPLDYPRINQFPEWYAIDAEKDYTVVIGERAPVAMKGAALIRGLELETGSQPLHVRISPRAAH